MPASLVDNSLDVSPGPVNFVLMTTLTMVLGGALILMVLLVVMGVGWWGVRALYGLQEGLNHTFRALEGVKGPQPDLEGTLQARVMALEVGFKGLRESTEEGVKRADNAWARIRGAEAMAKLKAEREAGDEGEEASEQLPLADGGLSPAKGVRPLHPPVGEPAAGDEPEYIRLARASGYPHV